MKNKKDDQKKERKSYFAIPAFLLIGLGIGLLNGNVAAFTLLGLGLGFLVIFLVDRIN